MISADFLGSCAHYLSQKIEPPMATKPDLSPESEPAKADNSSSFGRRLKLERLRRQLSQQEVATHCGVARTTQNSYEKDKRSPGLDYVEKLGELGFNLPYALRRNRPAYDDLARLLASPTARSVKTAACRFCNKSSGTLVQAKMELGYAPTGIPCSLRMQVVFP